MPIDRPFSGTGSIENLLKKAEETKKRVEETLKEQNLKRELEISEESINNSPSTLSDPSTIGEAFLNLTFNNSPQSNVSLPSVGNTPNTLHTTNNGFHKK